MASSETCEIKYIRLRGGGLLGLGLPICRWEALKMTTSGAETIYQSKDFQARIGGVEYQSPHGFVAAKGLKGNEQCDTEYEKMMGYLGGKGWRPVRTNRNGWITLMARQVAESKEMRQGGVSSYPATNAVDLLAQLANLRDAGILTEQEFQAKKAEILKRM